MRICFWFGIFRNKLCSKFAEALNKESRPDLTPIRVKELYNLECVEAVFRKYVIIDAGFFRILHIFCICSFGYFPGVIL
jgi:hypothetical protein